MKKHLKKLTLKEFLALNLHGFKRIKKDTDKHSYRLCWEKILLNDLIKEELKYSKEHNENANHIVVAIHKNQDDATIYEKIWKRDYGKKNFLERGENKPEELPDNFYYCDKWLNHFGVATYLIASGINKLYQTGKKYFIAEDYFDISKEETETVYFITVENDDYNLF